MSRAPIGRVHVPAEDPDTPGCCITCHRPLDAATDRHCTPAELPTPDPDTRALTARITGEHDLED